MNDQFFTKETCDRCGAKIGTRTMSWFNDDTICLPCSDKESEIKKQLPDGGRSFEGCGYLPDINIQEVKP